MRDFLLLLATRLTGKPRYKPPTAWNKDIWIINIFRLWEYIFGRAEGIKMESSSSVKQVNGRLILSYHLYTLEAVLVHTECTLRMQARLSLKLLFGSSFQYDYTPAYVILGILGLSLYLKMPVHSLPLVGLAIAHDADSNSGVKTTATSYSWNHTVTGSNPAIGCGFAIRPSGCVVSTLTYNSVTLTKIRADSNGNRVTELWYILTPTTGLNSMTVGLGGTAVTNSDGHAVSFSGVLGLDANNGNGNAGSANPTVSVTTVAANSWIFDVLCTGLDDGVATPTAPQVTAATNVANTGAHTGAQSYQGPVVTPASTAEAYTVTSAQWCISAASFSPVTAAATVKTLPTLGAGAG